MQYLAIQIVLDFIFEISNPEVLRYSTNTMEVSGILFDVLIALKIGDRNLRDRNLEDLFKSTKVCWLDATRVVQCMYEQISINES